MFDEKTKEAFEEYEILKISVKKAEDRIKELQPLLMEVIPEGKEIEGKGGVFYIQNRSTWEYTDKVKQYTKQLKDLKKDEEATGDAKQVLVPTLYFRLNKEEKFDDIPK